MLTVVLIWTYVLITTYLTGYGFLMALVNWRGMQSHDRKKRAVTYEFKFNETYIITGVVLVTIYAQIVSLLTRVGLGANVVLALVCVLIAVYYKEDLYFDGIKMLRGLRAHGDIYIYLAVFLLMAYGTSHGIMHYDSDLYHAQAIRWIEEYGVVKGLGNLHVRLAYNSAAFPVSALYSMHFITGQSYHVMSGFFALILAWQCVDIKNLPRRAHIISSDFARLAAIYYLFTIFDEIVSPASDYFLSTLVFYVIICLLDMYVKHERSYVPYILLALMGVFAITIKLSAAPMILLTAIPIAKLFSERTKEKMRAFWIAVALGLLITVPFLIRNVIISGWLLYPVTFLDFFNVKWKIPKGVADYDALEIKTFGRGYNDVARFGHVSFGEWVPEWFRSMSALNKIMLILSIVSIIVYLMVLAYAVISAQVAKKGNVKKVGNGKIVDFTRRSMLNTADFLAIGMTLIGCLVFWFFSASLIRYGVVYVWLTPAVILGRMLIIVFNRFSKDMRKLILRSCEVLFVLFMVYKGLNLVVDDVSHFNPYYLAFQQDYGEYETEEFQMGEYTFYYPEDGDRIGYAPFPGATHDVSGEVELMGPGISQGFITISQQ